MFKEGKSAFASGDGDSEEIFLNLTPMIDVLTCLLFFLLLSFGAVIIALINASVPIITDSGSDTAAHQTAITMGLTITPKGFELRAKNDSMTEEELNKLNKDMPISTTGYPYPALNEYLYTIKKKYRDSKTIIIIPESGIDYEVLIKTMDASREREIQFKQRPMKLPLFPEAVVSTIVK